MDVKVLGKEWAVLYAYCIFGTFLSFRSEMAKTNLLNSSSDLCLEMKQTQWIQQDENTCTTTNGRVESMHL
jgi:hypothetical protein